MLYVTEEIIASDPGGITLEGVFLGEPIILDREDTYAVEFSLLVDFEDRPLTIPVIARSHDHGIGGYAEEFRKVALAGHRVRVTGQLGFDSNDHASLELQTYMTFANDPTTIVDTQSTKQASREDFHRVVLYSKREISKHMTV